MVFCETHLSRISMKQLILVVFRIIKNGYLFVAVITAIFVLLVDLGKFAVNREIFCLPTVNLGLLMVDLELQQCISYLIFDPLRSF